MRILIVGAGAVGGLVAGHLAAAGRDVTLVARGAALQAIRERGVVLIGPDGTERRVSVSAVGEPADAPAPDAVITTTKAHSLTEAAPAIAAALGPETPVAFALNGIPWWYFLGTAGAPAAGGDGGPAATGAPGDEAGDATALPKLDPGGAILGAVGPARAVGCVVYVAAQVLEPGIVRHRPGPRLILGELDGRASERLARLAAAFEGSGIKAETTPRIRDAVWEKLLGNVIFNPMAVLTRATMAEIFADPALVDLARRGLEETMAIGRAYGARFSLTVEQRLEVARGLGAFKPSTLQDFEAGRPLEIEPIVGVPADLARRAGVPAPTLATVYALVRQLARSTGLYPEPAAS